MESLQVKIAVEFQHRIFFTEHAFGTENLLLRDVLSSDERPNEALVFVDAGVAHAQPELLPAIESYMHAHALSLAASSILVRGGERIKNDSQDVELALAEIERHHLSRHSFIIAIGGGAMLDAIGFAAAIAHRGVRLVRMPSTALAQADAGIGVKNGLNFARKKNFIGTFAPPFAVINDKSLLRTLTPAQTRDAYSEAIKVALIRDADFFDKIERNADALQECEPTVLRQLICRCAELHVQHIATSGDPFETGSARPLDFGHWSAHKLEQLSNFRISHGAAVAAGIAVDTAYSHLMGLLDRASADRVLTLLRRLGFDLSPAEFYARADEVLDGLEEFREHLGGDLTITLLRGIGEGVEVHAVDRDLMIQAMASLASG